MLKATLEAFGRVDTLVINHAMFDDSALMEYTSSEAAGEKLEKMLRVNTIAPMRLALDFLPHMRAEASREAGRIVFVSSGTAKASAPFHALYASTKLAVHGIADTLRAELALVDSARRFELAMNPRQDELASMLASAGGKQVLSVATWPSMPWSQRLAGDSPSISLLVLGMIGTPEVMKEPNLRALAMPVADCATAMMASADARAREAFIPGYLRLFVGLGRAMPQVTETIMQIMYTLHIDRYLTSLARMAHAVPENPPSGPVPLGRTTEGGSSRYSGRGGEL